MNQPPKWYLPAVVAALLWNLLGGLAYLSEVMISEEALAAMSAAEQAAYASRPAWAVSATAIAVWGGLLGCIALLMRKRWALPVLAASLVGVIVQIAGLVAHAETQALLRPAAVVLQGVVLLVAIGLVFLARRGIREGWLA
jgi:hypothetical protein